MPGGKRAYDYPPPRPLLMEHGGRNCTGKSGGYVTRSSRASWGGGIAGCDISARLRVGIKYFLFIALLA